jgi:hypothetical protein
MEETTTIQLLDTTQETDRTIPFNPKVHELCPVVITMSPLVIGFKIRVKNHPVIIHCVNAP